MTRPSDIPQDVWDAAMDAAAGLRNAVLWQSNASNEVIATCLASTRMHERERIAEWCEVTADAHDAEAVLAEEEADVVENRAAERALRSFANAIRKGAQ